MGRQWVWGITDCWSLVRDWYKEEKILNLEIGKRPTTLEEFNNKPLFEDCAWRTKVLENLDQKKN